MKRLFGCLLVVACTLTCLPVDSRASGASSGGGSNPSQEEMPDKPAMSPEEKAAAARRSAEEAYDQGYEETGTAGAEMDEARRLKALAEPDSVKKAVKLRESAGKRYKKAIDKFRKAVDLDPGYHEAWNMLGYSYRKTGQLGQAFKAYETCLKLNPDYAPAHEYLGEARLQAGDLDRAKAELAWLTERKSPEADNLAAAISRFSAGDSTSFGLGW